MFDFPKEKARLIKEDSSVIDNIDALFDGKTIFVDDASVCIEEGDVLERTLPNGLKEQFLVVDRGYYPETQGIPAHYQVKVEKRPNYHKATRGQIINSYVINDAGKVNINSTDNSTTIYQLNEQDKALFATLRELATQIKSGDDRDIKNKIDEMEQNIGKESFAEKYNAFIQSIANHITIFAPFLPMLTQLLSK